MTIQEGEGLLVARLHQFDEHVLIMRNRGWQAATIGLTRDKSNIKAGKRKIDGRIINACPDFESV